jgi:hypothetical protein
MKCRVLLLVMILSLVPFWNASAQERTLAGDVWAAPMQVDIKGNRAKFNEYRDLHDGVSGNIGLRYDAGKECLEFRAGDIGRRDQKYELEGGDGEASRITWAMMKFPITSILVQRSIGKSKNTCPIEG